MTNRTQRGISRGTKALIAAVASILWLGFMIVGLRVVDLLLPTAHGQGPAGTAAFIGLLGGVFVTGLVMWAAGD